VTPTDEVKRCTKCSKDKPLSDYRPHGRNKGLHPWCRACKLANYRAWCAANPDRAAWKSLRQRAHLLGLDRDEVSNYADAHDGRCDICGGPQTSNKYRLDIEHNHLTGEFRGMTCNDCNNIMRFAGDDPDRLRKVIAYMANPPAQAASLAAA
jgi:hypothetical protein